MESYTQFFHLTQSPKTKENELRFIKALDSESWCIVAVARAKTDNVRLIERSAFCTN